MRPFSSETPVNQQLRTSCQFTRNSLSFVRLWDSCGLPAVRSTTLTLLPSDMVTFPAGIGHDMRRVLADRDLERGCRAEPGCVEHEQCALSAFMAVTINIPRGLDSHDEQYATVRRDLDVVRVNRDGDGRRLARGQVDAAHRVAKFVRREDGPGLSYPIRSCLAD